MRNKGCQNREDSFRSFLILLKIVFYLTQPDAMALENFKTYCAEKKWNTEVGFNFEKNYLKLNAKLFSLVFETEYQKHQPDG